MKDEIKWPFSLPFKTAEKLDYLIIDKMVKSEWSDGGGIWSKHWLDLISRDNWKPKNSKTIQVQYSYFDAGELQIVTAERGSLVALAPKVKTVLKAIQKQAEIKKKESAEFAKLKAKIESLTPEQKKRLLEEPE
tara:strand:- start:11950 stop:12351 length:402 start_codon:yes stop_codon:yes gene_type:complete